MRVCFAKEQVYHRQCLEFFDTARQSWMVVNLLRLLHPPKNVFIVEEVDNLCEGNPFVTKNVGVATAMRVLLEIAQIDPLHCISPPIEINFTPINLICQHKRS